MKQPKLILLISILIFLFSGQLSAQFPKIGHDIIGDNPEDESGESVSLSANGRVLAIGAIENDVAGHVRVYEWSGTAWLQRGNDIDGEAGGDASGISVSLNDAGNILAIGATHNDGNGTEAGHVRIYEWTGTTWIQKGNDIDGDGPDDLFGRFVELNSNGTVLAVGSHGPKSDCQVRVYEWIGAAWVQRGNDIAGESGLATCGWSVSLDAVGNTLAIGVPCNDNINGNSTGRVRVFVWTGSTWVQRGNELLGVGWDDWFGWSVSLSDNGNILAIGGPRHDVNGNYTGHVQVYEWTGTAWTQRGNDIEGKTAGDFFGWSVSLSNSGNALAIGAPYNDEHGLYTGSAGIYEWNGTDWLQRGNDFYGDIAWEYFGWSVSLSDNGSTLAIGAPERDGSGVDAGIVRVYNVRGIYGYTYKDFNQNCVQDASENSLANRLLRLDPGNIILQTNNEGNWYLDSLPVGSYTLTADTSASNWELTCPVTQSFVVTNSDTSMLAPSFGYKSNYPCSDPNISIHAPFLRPGFSNQKVYIKACNQSNGSDILKNAFVIVELDSLLTVESGSHPYTFIGDNQYRIEADTVYPGFCIDFWLDCELSTSAILGQSLCMNATLYPVDSCSFDNTPNPFPISITPCTGSYDGSFLFVEGDCRNDTICFTVRNAGDGDMSCITQLRLYQDGQLFSIDSIQLLTGTMTEFCFPGDGRTWRLEVDQHPLLNGNSNPSATVEACGNPANMTSNLVNILPHNDANPVVDIFCGIVTGSYDPNDKTGYPLGLGTTHDIVPNQEIEYVIRFQNTGTDTAFTVVIRDTLSTDLDIFSVRSGVSSHPYSFRMYGPRVLEWTFNNIMLPDSNVNEPLSNGFVTFKVNQKSNLPIGTVIENGASIYFDFNAPIFTNVYFHTIDTMKNYVNWDGEETIVDTACNEFVLNNYSYTKSGVYWQPIYNNQLDSLYKLNLVVYDTEIELAKNNSKLAILNADSLYSYQWLDCLNGNVYIEGATGVTYYPPSHGSYAVEIIRGNCVDTSNCINFEHPNPQNELGIFVFPNPTADNITIAKNNTKEIQIRVFDNLGKLLVFRTTQKTIVDINLYDFATGIYYVHLCIDGQTTVQKIVKQ